MEHKIEILSTEISNKIAAGEVVQRPLSVVKELVENSIDAQSTHIKVILKNSGLDEIQIQDNGIGMNYENVSICLLRHATSKIKEEEDIYNIGTLGFRGEALPSIAAVSKFKLLTSTDGKIGYELIKEGDDPQLLTEVSANKGTQITVTNLFYNTPARFKHLSSTFYELSLIIQYINKAALTNPHVKLELINNDNNIFMSLGDGSIKNVMHKIYNNDIAKNILNFQKENDDFSVDFYIVKPQHTRSKKNNIHIGVNGRIIRNLAIENMIIKGYGQYLHTGQFPIAYINITTESSLIDINIHPTKEQIKIALINKLEELIVKSIKEQLNKEEYISYGEVKQENTLMEEANTLKGKEISLLDKLFADKQEDFSTPKKEVNTPKYEQKEETYTDSEKKVNQTESFNEQEEMNEYEKEVLVEDVLQEGESIKEPVTSNNLLNENNEQNINTNVEKEKLEQTLIQGGVFIGIHHKTYIMYENETGLFLIDQHAAQERINYEKILKTLSTKEYKIQKVLLPIMFELTQDEMLLIEDNLDKFKELGLVFEKFGHNFIRLVEVDSSYLKVDNMKQQIRWIIDTISNETKLEYSQIVDEIAISMACKASIKAHQYITAEDAKQLLTELSACHEPYTCPHGRPVIVALTNYQIQKMFKRVT